MNTISPEFLAERDGIRWFGDVHGDLMVRSLVDEARAKNYAIGFIGDLTDQGSDDNGKPSDSADVIRLLIELDRTGEVIITPGNHCFKLLRYLIPYQRGETSNVKTGHGLAQTIEEIMTSHDRDRLIEGFVRIVGSAPIFHRIGDYVFAHAAVVPGMFHEPAPIMRDAMKAKNGMFHRCLYGQTDGTTTADGFPTRRYDWVDTIPHGKTVIIGHDKRKQITVIEGAQGGRLIHLDTGAGKGGHLSTIDLGKADLGL